MRHTIFGLATFAALAGSAAASDGLRVAAWNITNYGGGNAANIATAVYGEFEGRQFAPDVILLQEILSSGALDSLASAMNSAAGSPGDWTGATFYAGGGGGLNTALVYRTSKLDFMSSALLWPGSASANPRHIVRYDMRLDGYTSDEAVISFYPVHMKAGSGSSDQSRRLIEAQRIRDNAQTLPAGQHFVIGGDFNIQSAFQSAYIELTGSQTNNNGRFFDPIATPGSWNNNWTYRMIHTQDPSGNGGMDDRHDQLLVSISLGDGIGSDYIGQFSTPWDLSTWGDADHSYRCWGNDGTTFDLSIRTTGNEMVGPAIAQSLKFLAGSGGHLPVYFDMVVPAKVGVDTVSIDFGSVVQGDPAIMNVTVSNAGDVVRWGENGIEDLAYELVTTGAISAASGSYSDPAGGGGNPHNIVAETSTAGPIVGTLFIDSNDPDTPSLEIVISGVVIAPPCPADVAEPFGVLDLSDVSAFVGAFVAQEPLADIAEPFGVFDLFDVNLFTSVFVAGCP